MLHDQITSFQQCFQQVDDPRVAGRSVHKLDAILFLVVTATIAGADGPAEIEAFGVARKNWLSRFVELPHGIPSHDTIGRVLAIIKPDQFQRALLAWISHLREGQKADGPVAVQIDGKTARGSYTAPDKSDALHIVSAWASAHGVTLGQLAVDSKSNEITAIPALLKMLDLRNTIITIDAMGCQKSIARQIVDGGGDYIFALKANHPTLLAAVQEVFFTAHETGLSGYKIRCTQTTEKSRGRLEERFYAVGPVPESLKSQTAAWANVKSIGQITRVVTQGDTQTIEVSYYLSSRAPRVKEFAGSVRSHWGIESMHWILDVVFGEDASRLHLGHSAENMSFTRRFVTSLLKQDSSRSSLKTKRKRAGWDTGFLEKLLFHC